MHLRLYNKPHVAVAQQCTLALTGSLPDYGQANAYTGTLQAAGGNGSVRIVTWDGDLPPGADVRYDATNSQVVVTWPAFDPGSIDAENFNFEAGDIGWDLGPGWTIMQGVTAPDPNDANSAWQAQYADQGGSSEFLSHKAIPAVPGKTYIASMDVQQGATSANNAGAAVRLAFFDADGKRIPEDAGQFDGSVVKSGSNSKWSTSSLSVNAPANAATVKLGGVAFRKRENKPLWVDNLAWNGAYQAPTVGTNGSSDIPFSVTIADGDNCRATWRGVIPGRPSDIIASIDFESGDFTDSTGRVWTVDGGDAQNHVSHATTAEPTVIVNPSGDGKVMSKCPDVSGYLGTEDFGIRTALGDAAFGTDVDFCIELDVRANATYDGSAGNISQSFLGVYLGGAVMSFGARFFAPMPFENTKVPLGLTRTYWNPPNLVLGDWFHFAVCRQGDLLGCFYNGTIYAIYSGASARNITAADDVIVGHADGSDVDTEGWPGQFDNVRITRGWSRYPVTQ